ncbi:MAG: signal peptidase I [Ruminococcus sp.]|nr:signal peptidase I [Ruminococcus sp.]
MVKKIFRIATTVLLVILIAIVIMVFITRMNGKSPSIFGYTVFRVQTDSMVPTLQVGDVILDKHVDADQIKVGDIITYNCLKGELKGQTITHRVISGPDYRDGECYFTTMGDKEGARADDEITYSQIEGKYLQTLPIVDKLYTFFLSPVGLIVFIGVIVILFAYEMISLIIAYKSVDEHDDDYYEPKPKKESKKRKKPKKTHLN